MEKELFFTVRARNINELMHFTNQKEILVRILFAMLKKTTRCSIRGVPIAIR